MISRLMVENDTKNVDSLKLNIAQGSVKYLILLAVDKQNEGRFDSDKLNKIADVIADYDTLNSIDMYNYVVERAIEDAREDLDLEYCIDKCFFFIEKNLTCDNGAVRSLKKSE